MNNLADFGLATHPFPVVPDAHVTHWAGRPEVKRLLLDIAQSVRGDDTGLSEFVIVYGDFGAGKTHALKYLATVINEAEADEYQSMALYMPKIKVGPKLSFLELYKRLFQEVTASRVVEIAKAVKVKINAEADRLGEELPNKEVRKIYDEHQSLNHLVIEQAPEGNRSIAPAPPPYRGRNAGGPRIPNGRKTRSQRHCTPIRFPPTMMPFTFCRISFGR